MPDAEQRELHCPRCGYNLRGLDTPRCPECGMTFPPQQWQTGVLRESLPTWLDRCDPWQPHQVLIRSLYELFRGALRPGRLLTKLDLDGPLVPAGLMLVFGTLWLYVLATLLIAAATLIHTGASPAASLKSAALGWGPRALVLALGAAVPTLGLVGFPDVVRVVRAGARQYLRLAAYWVPAMGMQVVVPAGVALLAVPEFLARFPRQAGLLPVVTAVFFFSRQHEVRLFAGGRRDIAMLLCATAAWIAVVLLAPHLLPRSLEPPMWVYS